MRTRSVAITFIVVFAAGLLAGGVFHGGDTFRLPGVFAQGVRPTGTGGVMAFPAQLDKETFGIVMVDVDAGTIWIYHLKHPGSQLKLLAARSWVYDRQLEEYNCAPPLPGEISQLLMGQQGEPKKLENPATKPLE